MGFARGRANMAYPVGESFAVTEAVTLYAQWALLATMVSSAGAFATNGSLPDKLSFSKSIPKGQIGSVLNNIC